MPSKPQGLVRLALYQKLIDSIPYGATPSDVGAQAEQGVSAGMLGYPTVAIGGIAPSNAEKVWQTGVSSLAVVRAITLADSPKPVIAFFTALMKERQLTFAGLNNASTDGVRDKYAHG